ncbi:unnamed protein product [Rhizophagus irregularis]|nr:unnamed protein product [Rhizophagus irregularis]CAB5356255.1 unnamed protein product [Rhizophagus irregularis]
MPDFRIGRINRTNRTWTSASWILDFSGNNIHLITKIQAIKGGNNCAHKSDSADTIESVCFTSIRLPHARSKRKKYIWATS